MPATPQAGAPLPSAAGDAEATQLIPPLNAQSGQAVQPGQMGQPGQAGQPGPVGPTGPTGSTGPIGPGAGPVPGAVPQSPQASARPERPGESTQLLRPVKAHQPPPQAQPLPQSPQQPGQQPQPYQQQPQQSQQPQQQQAAAALASEPTQLIPPVGGGTPPPPGPPFGARPGTPDERRTPSEFDGLFRPEAAGAPPGVGGPGGGPEATQQLPRLDASGQPQPGGPYQFDQQYAAQPPYDPLGDGPGYDDDGGGRRRRLGPAVVVGAVIVALAGVGLGVGWALSGGDSPEKKDTGSSSTGAAQGGDGKDTDKGADKDKDKKEPAADPAAAQAKDLDALLNDSNSSRSAVVGAVDDIKSCDNLDGAAKDLRGAAGQRNDLVARLAKLPVDKIPHGSELTASLTKAWKSSAAADNHYAAWAKQVKGKKGCNKGKARGTKEAARANKASGEATKAKKQSAALWNPIAKKYGLTTRGPGQL
ncbi:hypothetical protein [Streptomyces sp. MST-110588]|uniref:hypothetical protein n=1 Tax=Streptomyces sp. MST-110588 TaxID=2833628 RepID=UPI001F5C43ED|nr:hypothetical protein [Streptomyces sp. MST-110588]